MTLLVFLWIVSLIAVVLFVGMIGLMATMAWTNKRRLETEGLVAKAQIMEVEINDGEGRLVPFARMKVNVPADEPFVTTVETFCPPDELPFIHVGGNVDVLYHPVDKTCKIIFKELPVRQNALQWKVKRSILPDQKLSAA